MFGPMPRPPWAPIIDGPALRQVREQRGLTQRGLVAECRKLGVNVDPGNLQRAEDGLSGAIGPKKLPAVAQALEVDVAELLTDHGKTVITIPRADGRREEAEPGLNARK